MIDFKSVGGVLREIGSRKEWNFGWIPREMRTASQQEVHEAIRSRMPRFALPFTVDEELDAVDLTDSWTRKEVVDALGMPFTGVRQITGSCVGAAGGAMATTDGIIGALEKYDLDLIQVAFWLLPYGRSRLYFGENYPGEGSLGSTFSKAGLEDGFLDAKLPGLPTYTTNDMFCWGKAAELAWSDGDAKQTLDLLPTSRQHLFKQSVPVRTTDEVEQGLRALRPFTTASTLIPEPVIESDGEAYGRVQRSGGHQTCILGVKRHATKGGRWFLYVNQWGLAWGKRSMCWIPDADLQRMIDDGDETYMWEGLLGTKKPTFSWLLP